MLSRDRLLNPRWTFTMPFEFPRCHNPGNDLVLGSPANHLTRNAESWWDPGGWILLSSGVTQLIPSMGYLGQKSMSGGKRTGLHCRNLRANLAERSTSVHGCRQPETRLRLLAAGKQGTVAKPGNSSRRLSCSYRLGILRF